MADRKISDLTALTTPATGDLIPIVDVSEAAAADKNKSITVGELLRGAPDGTAAAPGIAFESDGGNGMFLGGTDILAFSTGGSQAVTIDASQRVGIGVSTLSNVLHVHQTDASANSYVHITQADGGSAATDGLSIGIENGGVNAVIRNRENGYIRMYTNDEERLRIDSSGRLLVGTNTSNDASAQSNLIIESNSSGATSYGGLMLRRGETSIAAGTSLGRIYFADQSGNVGARISGHGNDTWATDDYPGYLLIETTSDGAAAPTERVRIRENLFRIGASDSGSGTSGTSQLQIVDTTNNVEFIMRGTSPRIIYDITGTNEAELYYDNRNFVIYSGTPAGTSSERLRVDADGRLLVGTSTSTSVAGFGETKIQSRGNYESSITVVNTENNANTCGLILAKVRSTSIVQNGDPLGGIYYQGYDGSAHKIGASILAYVDGTPGTNDMPGRLVFSTTADGASSPTERFRIASAGWVQFYPSATVDAVNIAHPGAAGTTYRYLYGAANGTNTFTVFNNGNVQNTNNSYTGISDIKLKENIVDASSQWDDLKAIQIRNYNFKEETGQQTHTQLGVVAQEVELVSPGLVSESPDRDEEGNDLGTTTKSVNYSVLYMKAVKALQEAMERIETLEANNVSLEARLAALEAN